jgi:tetratricopeptide (TPR) repeat protein
VASTLHFQAGRYEEALAHLDPLLALVPEFALGHGAKAEGLHALGRHEEALASARHAVEIQPDLVPARVALATILNAGKEHEEALEVLEATPGPPNPGALVQSGLAKSALGRKDEALADLERSLQLLPGNFQAHALVAGLHLEQHRVEEALASAKRAVEVAPGAGGGRFLLGIVLRRMGRIEDAAAAFEKGLELGFESEFAKVDAATLPAYEGRPEEAVRRLRTLAATHPDDAHVQSVLAWVLSTYPVQDRSPEEAVALARRGLELADDPVPDALAASLFRAGEHKEAEAHFEELEGRVETRSSAGLAFLRAMNLLALGREDDARRWYEEGGRRLAAQGRYPDPHHVWVRDEAAKRFGDD